MIANFNQQLEKLRMRPPAKFDPSEKLSRGNFIHNITGHTMPEEIIGEVALRLGVLENSKQKKGFEEYINIIHDNVGDVDDEREEETVLTVSLATYDDMVLDRWGIIHEDLMRRTRNFGSVLVSHYAVDTQTGEWTEPEPEQSPKPEPEPEPELAKVANL